MTTKISTPCIKICELNKNICMGCHRTIGEIKEWKDLIEMERIYIMEEIIPERLKTSLERLDKRHI